MSEQTETLTGHAVRVAMTDKGVSQRRLARELGLSQAAVSRRLLGEVDFSIGQLRAIAKVLEVPVVHLVPEEAA